MVDWRAWSSESLERARLGKKPILLHLAAPWSSRCREMDRSTYQDPEVLGALRDFVCVRVDADRRPDIYSRYQQGGWPTIAFLTPEGELFYGTTFLDSAAMIRALRKASAVLGSDDGSLDRALASWRERETERKALSAMLASLDPAAPERFLSELKADYDLEHGGFGRGRKFPLPESLECLLYAAQEGQDGSAREKIVQTLRAMARGLRDPVDGGFFRYCAERDWTRPHQEKLLSDNARLIRLYFDAYALTGEPGFKTTAVETLGYIGQILFSPELGGYRGSQADDQDYYRLGRSERFKSGGPGVDPTVYCDSNAMMVPALLKAAAHIPERRGEFEGLAQRVLEFLKTRFFDHHAGMFHYLDQDGIPQAPSLLGDHAWTMIAFTEAFQYFGDREYREFSDGLLRLTLRDLWHREQGGFWDRDPDEPALGRVREPFLNVPANAAALEALWRLSQMKGIPNYAKWLDMGLRGVLPWALGPHETAPLGRVLDIHLKGRLELDFIGRKEDPRGRALLVDLYRFYLPRKIVSFIDPDDMDFILAHRLSAPRYPRIFILLDGRLIGSGETLQEIEPILSSL